MAAGPGALPQMVMQALQARTQAAGMPGAGGPPGAPPGMPGAGGMPSAGGAGAPGMGGTDPAQEYAQQVASLKGADPGMLLRQLDQIKKIIASMAVENMERLPNVAGQLFRIVPSFDRVIKEAQQAANVSAAVRNQIGMSQAQPPQQEAQGALPGGTF